MVMRQGWGVSGDSGHSEDDLTLIDWKLFPLRTMKIFEQIKNILR